VPLGVTRASKCSYISIHNIGTQVNPGLTLDVNVLILELVFAAELVLRSVLQSKVHTRRLYYLYT